MVVIFREIYVVLRNKHSGAEDLCTHLFDLVLLNTSCSPLQPSNRLKIYLRLS